MYKDTQRRHKMMIHSNPLWYKWKPFHLPLPPTTLRSHFPYTDFLQTSYYHLGSRLSVAFSSNQHLYQGELNRNTWKRCTTQSTASLLIGSNLKLRQICWYNALSCTRKPFWNWFVPAAHEVLIGRFHLGVHGYDLKQDAMLTEVSALNCFVHT